MATPITKTVGPQAGADYGSIYEVEAVNRNLVGVDESWTVNLAGNQYGSQIATLTLSGWTTDATRFLKFIGPPLPDQNMINQDNLYDRAVVRHSAGNAIGISGMGAGCLVIFENMIFHSTTAAGTSPVSISAVNGTIRFVNCIFFQRNEGGGNPAALTVNSATCTIECINCTFISKLTPGGYGVLLTACAAASKFYHCTAIAFGIGFNCNGQIVTLKNCYSRATVAYGNIGAATLVTCASSDATGTPAGLQNVPFDYTNWNSAVAGFELDTEPIGANPCLNGGTDISGEGAPWNVPNDCLGVAYVTATPSVGCRQYTVKVPRIRHIFIGPGGFGAYPGFNDFATLGALSAINRDLVANTERWFVECADLIETVAVAFNGWVTNSTYYLHIRNPQVGNKIIRGHLSHVNQCTTTPGAYSHTKTTAGDSITMGDIGATGLIILEGLQFGRTGVNAGHVLVNSAAGIGGTVQLRDCHIYGNVAGFGISSPAGGGNNFIAANCVFVAGGIVTTKVVDWNSGVFKAYHCTLLSTDSGGVAHTVLDMHNTAGCELVNCHAQITNAFAGSACYRNMAGVTFTKCSSTDATGSEAGLQNIPYNAANWLDTAVAGAQWMVPKSTGALVGAGADVSAQTFPLNCLSDYTGSIRQTSNPTIGAMECPIAVNPDYNGSWLLKQTGINTVNAKVMKSLVSFSVDGKLYGSTAPQAGKAAEIYSSVDDGDNWVLEYTYPSVNIEISGGVEAAGKLYFVGYNDAKVITYNPVGPVWSTGAANLGGAAGAPTLAKTIFYTGARWYCVHGNNTIAPVYSSANSVAWAADTMPVDLVATSNTIAGGDNTDAGDIVGFSATTLFWKRAGAAAYNSILLEQYHSTAQPVLYVDKLGRKAYIICVSPTWGTGSATVTELDLATQTIKCINALNRNIAIWDGATKGFFITRVGADIWFGAIRDGTPSGIDFWITANPSPHQQFGTFQTRMNITANASFPGTQTGALPCSAMHNGRMFIAVGTGTAQYAGVLMSPLLVNATKIDDVVVQQASWNEGLFTGSVMVKGDTINNSGYVKLLGQTKDSSPYSPDYSVRRLESYYKNLSSSLWQRIEFRMDLRDGGGGRKESGLDMILELYKDSQSIYLDGLHLESGSLIPSSFQHPLESRAVESFTTLNVVDLNNCHIEFYWTPTASFIDVDLDPADIEIARISKDATNYISISLAKNSSFFNQNADQREYNPRNNYRLPATFGTEPHTNGMPNVHGPHDPVIRLNKVRAGAVEATIDLVCYCGYDLTDPAGELIDDPIKFSIIHFARTGARSFTELKITRFGDVASDWSSAGQLFATPSLASVDYKGFGYFSPPEVIKEFSTSIGRKFPTGRLGLLERVVEPPVTGSVFPGERDPVSGSHGSIIEDAYLGDSFDRVDQPVLGYNWATFSKTLGAGFSIISNDAYCTQTEYAYWNARARHADLSIQINFVLSHNTNVVGILSRFDPECAGVTGYGAEVIQTGVNAASVRVVIWTNGTRTILATTALSSYSAGETLSIVFTLLGSLIAAEVWTVSGMIASRGSASITDTNFKAPIYNGIYGQSGVGENVKVSFFYVSRQFITALTT